jgi:hypothetical protein
VTPLSTALLGSGVLVIGDAGNLRLLDDSGQTTWSYLDTTGSSASAVVIQLLESGNLVVHDNILWQSFDHPSNTLLDGMQLGKNPKTGDRWSLTSWRASLL